MNREGSVIEDMKKFGLSEYEARAYLSLLRSFPVNGYTVSKNSGIPRSRIYEVLKSLRDKHLVFETVEGKNVLYYPLNPKLLLEKLNRSFKDSLKNIEEYTEKLFAGEKQDNRLTVIKGREKILKFLELLISNAENRIAVSIWEEEINEISDALREALKRGVVLKGIYFGKNNTYGELVTHRRIERYLAEKKERYMTVTIDRLHVMSGIISRGEDSQVTWTKDRGFAEMSEDFIVHDIMVNIYAGKLKGEERKRYESFLDDVRKDYFGF